MIKKFVNIKNIGRLVSCSQKGPELTRYNLFFAENGRGKTTLCAVLRSLQTGQHEHITERKTIAPVTGEPSVEVRLDGTSTRFNAKAWSQTVPEIAIFDSTFVSQNVHAGEFVSRDHRANLLQVIIGADGVRLAAQVNALDEAIREKNGAIATAKKVLQQHLPKTVTAEDFVGLAEDADVDTKIVVKTAQLTAAKRADEIKRRAALVEAAVPSLPPDFAAVLAQTLAEVSAEAETRVKAQIATHQMHARGAPWIADGVGFVRNDACPFCGQLVAGLPLISAYKQFFSESYAALRDKIQALHAQINQIIGDAALAGVEHAVVTNAADVEFWSQFVAIMVPALNVEDAFTKPAVSLRAAALALVARKIANPLEAVATDADFTTAATTFEVGKCAVTAYNVAIKLANALIAQKKTDTAAADAGALERELSGLKLIKLRNDPTVKPLCIDLVRLLADKTALDRQKAEAKTALDTHADAMIQDYEASINTLLAGFDAGFSITNSKKTYIGGTPTSTYQILINQLPVDIGDGGTPIGQPCFRTTLSAGDKSTLALAFFLAQLDHDPTKATRIVVFDDPFNSQDRSRRERTAELLKKYGAECAQLFLLSHDPHFLNLLFSKLPHAQRHSLQLSRIPGNATTIEEWDVDEETKDGYFREHAALASYLLNGSRDLIGMARKIRPVLEGYLRYRFPNQFPANKWLGDMIGHVRTTGATHPMSGALDELTAINDYSKRYHHDTNPGRADGEPLDDGELQGFVKRALAIAGGY